MNFEKRLIINKPDHLLEFDDTAFSFDETCKDKFDLIIAFVFTLEQMKEKLFFVNNNKKLNENGYLYFAYPKKGNKVYKEYIGRDSILPFFGIEEDDGYVEGTDLKFSKMVALNNVFTIVGLKQLSKRAKKNNAPNNCVNDYVLKNPEVRRHLE